LTLKQIKIEASGQLIISCRSISIQYGRQEIKTLNVDTDDLSRAAYDGVLLEAEKLTHDLTLNFALLSSDCINEIAYMKEAEKFATAILKMEAYELDDLFWGNPPDKQRLNLTLKKILENIGVINSIPFEKRTVDF
jgi:hypothetical protein